MRFYVRFRIQKEIGWDDGFLIFGLACLISGVVMLFNVIDDMYVTEAVVFGEVNLFTMDFATFIPKSIRYRKISAAALTLMWFSICSVKFSFLALFKKLIRQMPGMIRYWWFTVAFNIVVTGYGASVYLVACPYFSADEIFKASKLFSRFLSA